MLYLMYLVSSYSTATALDSIFISSISLSMPICSVIFYGNVILELCKIVFEDWASKILVLEANQELALDSLLLLNDEGQQHPL